MGYPSALPAAPRRRGRVTRRSHRLNFRAHRCVCACVRVRAFSSCSLSWCELYYAGRRQVLPPCLCTTETAVPLMPAQMSRPVR